MGVSDSKSHLLFSRPFFLCTRSGVSVSKLNSRFLIPARLSLLASRSRLGVRKPGQPGRGAAQHKQAHFAAPISAPKVWSMNAIKGSIRNPPGQGEESEKDSEETTPRESARSQKHTQKKEREKVRDRDGGGVDKGCPNNQILRRIRNEQWRLWLLGVLGTASWRRRRRAADRKATPGPAVATHHLPPLREAMGMGRAHPTGVNTHKV